MAQSVTSSSVRWRNSLGKVISMASCYPALAVEICNLPVTNRNVKYPHLFLSFEIPIEDMTDILHDFNIALQTLGMFYGIKTQPIHGNDVLTKVIIKICGN